MDFRKGYKVKERIGNEHFIVHSELTNTDYLISKYGESDRGVPLYNLDICINAYEGRYQTVIGNHNNGVPYRMVDGTKEYLYSFQDGIRTNFRAIVKELYTRDNLIKARKESKDADN